jgi:Ca2+-binding EF-hand superfamily protein
MGNNSSRGSYLERQFSQASGTDVQTIRTLYSDFQNDCPSGNLTLQKFTELYARVSKSNHVDEFQAKACSRFDKWNNGTINFRDFLMVVHLTSTGSAEDKLRTLFSLYDQDGNGVIDAEEMNSVIHGIYQMLGEASHGESMKMFIMMDKDGDGKITEQEFISAALEDPGLVRMLSTGA